ncbi:MAG: hypothetical protein PHP53_24325 [Prolixibacteraceae bacterium]|nr:hypothetical protein [Prolixibacteraceae bacterium]
MEKSLSQGKMMNKSIDSMFDDIYERIKTETDIRSLRQLAKIIKKDQSTISAAKSKENFPANWAWEIEKKYGLLTKWIMTGEGPKKIEEMKGDFIFYEELEEWARETGQSKNTQWLRNQIESFFPMFKEWKKRKEEGNQNRDKFASSKIA